MTRRLPQDGIRILDLFSGAGGLSLGWAEATADHGGRLIAAVDSDEALRPLYAHNFPEATFLAHTLSPVENGDAQAVSDALALDEVDVLLAAPPCQSFSSAGKRSASHLDNRLAMRVAELTKTLRPRVVVMENVPEFVTAEGGRLIGRVRVQLSAAGYETQVATLNASAYGLPQIRQRSFVLGVRGKCPGAARRDLVPPPATAAQGSARSPMPAPGGGLPNPPSVRDAIGDLPCPVPARGPDECAYDRPPSTPYQERARRVSRCLYNHVAVAHSSEMRELLGGLRPGETPQRHEAHPLRRKDYFRSAYARLLADGVASTMTTQTQNPGSGRFTHPTADRVLTVREVARLQGFPDHFRFIGTFEAQRRHVGNAVPPPVAYAIASHLLPYLLSDG